MHPLEVARKQGIPPIWASINEEEGKTIMKKKSEKLTDLCGCVWEIQEDIWVCVKHCHKHSKPKSKRPHRPKAESVRSGGKFD
jgi:hypothetical protein